MTPEKKPRKEISAGFIVFRRSNEGPKFLILYHGHHYWNFPKGKIESSPSQILQGKTWEGKETSLRAAFRETREETGLSENELRMARNFRVYQKYFFKQSGQPVFKIVILYLAETRNSRIRLSSEHQGYGWFSYPEAMRILARYKGNQKILKQAYDYIRGAGARRGSEHSARQDGNI